MWDWSPGFFSSSWVADISETGSLSILYLTRNYTSNGAFFSRKVFISSYKQFSDLKGFLIFFFIISFKHLFRLFNFFWVFPVDSPLKPNRISCLNGLSFQGSTILWIELLIKNLKKINKICTIFLKQALANLIHKISVFMPKLKSSIYLLLLTTNKIIGQKSQNSFFVVTNSK